MTEAKETKYSSKPPSSPFVTCRLSHSDEPTNDCQSSASQSIGTESTSDGFVDAPDSGRGATGVIPFHVAKWPKKESDSSVFAAGAEEVIRSSGEAVNLLELGVAVYASWL